VVLETVAPPEAVISAPGLDGPYYEDQNGERMYDESKYLGASVGKEPPGQGLSITFQTLDSFRSVF
jgi:hypothetical protein